VNWRSPKLLEAAKDCPCCFGCGRHNDGTIVMAHSNQFRDGKGRSIKAHDYRVAALCWDCHKQVDEGRDLREQREALWERAHRATLGWLIESGKLIVK